MSFEINKLMCALLSALLVYLMASFIEELIYHKDKKEKSDLAYYIGEDIEEKKDKTEKVPNDVKITEENLSQLIINSSPIEGEKFIKKNCSSCHDFDMPIKNKIGPSLARVFNREIGKIADYKYSKTLKNMNEKWNLINLYFFLEKPKEWAAGTKMSYKGISDQKNLLNTIKFIEFNSIKNED